MARQSFLETYRRLADVPQFVVPGVVEPIDPPVNHYRLRRRDRERQGQRVVREQRALREGDFVVHHPARDSREEGRLLNLLGVQARICERIDDRGHRSRACWERDETLNTPETRRTHVRQLEREDRVGGGRSRPVVGQGDVVEPVPQQTCRAVDLSVELNTASVRDEVPGFFVLTDLLIEPEPGFRVESGGTGLVNEHFGSGQHRGLDDLHLVSSFGGRIEALGA